MSAAVIAPSMHPRTRGAVLAALRSGLAPLMPLPSLTLSDFASEHFILSRESSQETGKWRPDPPQIAIMNAMSDDEIEEVNVRKAKRLGYTKMLVALFAYMASWKRRNQIMYQPTDDDRDSFVRTELEPSIRDVDTMSRVTIAGRIAQDTIKLKMFLGSVAHFLGGKAARAYRRVTAALVVMDEIDQFDQVVENSVDPVEGARGRLEGAPFPKLVIGTTPRIKGLSHIERREQAADVRLRYHVDCPGCKVDHPIIAGDAELSHGFKWDAGDISTAHHLCPHCGYRLTQAEFLRIWHRGRWTATDGSVYINHHQNTWHRADGTRMRPPRHVAFVDWWAAYSPRRLWSDIAREKHEAAAAKKAGQDGPMQTFVNETEGRTWEVKFEKSDEHALMRRAEDYPLRTVPWGGLVLVAGVDMQDTWWEIVVWAIGRGEEMWVVDHVKIAGNPGDMREWETKLEPYFDTIFPHAAGTQMKIEGAAFDTMGHFTHQAYNFCRLRERKKFYAVRGDPAEGKPIGGRATVQDVNWRGTIIKRGVKLWYVGTDTAADTFHARLQVAEPGPGYVHFSKQLTPEFFHGLTCESRVPIKSARGTIMRWVNVDRARNEPTDCTRYALFVAVRLNLHSFTNAMWTRLESIYQPRAGDLFAEPARLAQPPADDAAPATAVDAVVAAKASKTTTARAERRRNSYVNKYLG